MERQLNNPEKGFRVAVVGAGIVGLLCAIGLTRAPNGAKMKVEVFEAAAEFGEIGAGIGLGPNAIQALKAIGVLDALLEKVPLQPSAFKFRELSGSGDVIYEIPARDNDYVARLYRPVYLDALVPMLDPACVHFRKRCLQVTVSTTGCHVIHFADGTSHETDLVIGADGIRSVCRDFVTNGENRLAFSGRYAYRGLIPVEALKQHKLTVNFDQPNIWLGRNEHVIAYTIKDGELLNFVPVRKESATTSPVDGPWVRPVSTEEILDKFSSSGEDISTMIKLMENPVEWALHMVHPSLHTFSREKTVLVGDAAHAMLPHMGAGAGQGIEDAVFLSLLLTHPATDLANIDVVLEVYNKYRVPRANGAAARSARTGEVYGSYSGNPRSLDYVRDELRDFVWHHDLNKDLDEAFAVLGEMRNL
ncbi:FAD/NAD(P)-binding domain-containing protein [Fistulina hepatica ATCC 64428]|uniref:FAD/NAD(P)-binding domain-containing protein n=1 Tax=Fistulina hepatica ATCC 64428 TaxID=1128425 RepID=A0A0D7A812_9AGAR|nr:FAD/NAD(P)-binding domain-containing protein [Fistulina hepatica ATCC 64428]